MGLGYIEGVTHDYQRHGTTTLFAALNVLDGAIIAQCKPRHRHQEFLAFLRHIETNVPAKLDIHLVVDNYATHKHPKVRAWLARRPRWHIHFAPTYASWLNQVERFFALITQRAIRRGSFDSTADLVKRIDRFIRTHNANSQPFVWTATVTQSSRNSRDFVSEFPGQNTSRAQHCLTDLLSVAEYRMWRRTVERLLHFESALCSQSFRRSESSPRSANLPLCANGSLKCG
jgi:transposase